MALSDLILQFTNENVYLIMYGKQRKFMIVLFLYILFYQLLYAVIDVSVLLILILSSNHQFLSNPFCRSVSNLPPFVSNLFLILYGTCIVDV